MAECCPITHNLPGGKFPIKIGKAIIIHYAIGGRGIPDYYSRRTITVPIKENIPIEELQKSYETALTQTGYSTTTKFLLVRRAENLFFGPPGIRQSRPMASQ